MIRESFCFLPKIREKKEQQLWKLGITDWNSFIETKDIAGIGDCVKQQHNELLQTARQKLWEEDVLWFAKTMKQKDHWRLYNKFKEDAVYLDIETDGYYGGITVVGLYDGNQTMSFVRGVNLDKRLLEQQLAKYKMVVTFNGAAFDLPVIKRYFNISCNVPHVDLRFVCQKAGFSGGLKQIEKDLGIKRADEVVGVTGSDAVTLWQQFRETGNKEYLDLILKYNEEDIINLPIIANKVIPSLWNSIRKS